VRCARAWLLTGALLLLGNTAHAGLQLQLKTEGLTPAQQQASQALLDEAMQALPPRFIEQLDRRIVVGWTDDMPRNAYGQASLVSELDLNRNLLAGLTDGSAASKKNPSPPWHRAPGNAGNCAARADSHLRPFAPVAG